MKRSLLSQRRLVDDRNPRNMLGLSWYTSIVSPTATMRVGDDHADHDENYDDDDDDGDDDDDDADADNEAQSTQHGNYTDNVTEIKYVSNPFIFLTR